MAGPKALIERGSKTPRQELQHRFDYHPPRSDDVAEAHQAARTKFKSLAVWVAKNIPEGREQALVLTQLEQGLFWANAAIARSQDSEHTEP